jgi:TfoX/Sxy family transcriptional regulator of competence genes
MLAEEPGIVAKRMFGGLAFLVNGHLAVGASSKGGLMLRVEPAQTESLLAEPGAEPFEMQGRPTAGWLRVALDGSASEDELGAWVDRGLAYARTLPPK